MPPLVGDTAAVPAVGVPLHGPLVVVAVCEALAALEQYAVLAVTVYQYWVLPVNPNIVALVPA